MEDKKHRMGSRVGKPANIPPVAFDHTGPAPSNLAGRETMNDEKKAALSKKLADDLFKSFWKKAMDNLYNGPDKGIEMRRKR